MSVKHKPSKNKVDKIDEAENRKFMIILGVATVALMVIMYLIFA